jgi:hypothetical protein
MTLHVEKEVDRGYSLDSETEGAEVFKCYGNESKGLLALKLLNKIIIPSSFIYKNLFFFRFFIELMHLDNNIV